MPHLHGEQSNGEGPATKQQGEEEAEAVAEAGRSGFTVFRSKAKDADAREVALRGSSFPGTPTCGAGCAPGGVELIGADQRITPLEALKAVGGKDCFGSRSDLVAGAPGRHPPPHGTPPYPSVDNAVMPRELFRFDTAASVADFSAIDDRVMGGRSASRLRHDPAGHAIFEGEVSLANGGGFASVRSRSLPLGDAQAVTCRIEVLGDGKRYKLGLRTDDLFDGVTYQATFEPVSGEWTVLRLPLASFKPTWRGRPIDGGSAVRPESVRQLGLVIGDGQAGLFALALRSIALE